MCAIAAAIIHSFTAHSTDLEVERSLALESDEQVVALAKQKEDLELQILDLEERLDEEQEVNAKLSETKRKLEQQVDQLRQQLAEETVNVERLQVQQFCHCQYPYSLTHVFIACLRLTRRSVTALFAIWSKSSPKCLGCHPA
jgi:hypothetical protein